MGTPFKMKGSPFQRNFGIGSPLNQLKASNTHEGKPIRTLTDEDYGKHTRNVNTGEIRQDINATEKNPAGGFTILQPGKTNVNKTKTNAADWVDMTPEEVSTAKANIQERKEISCLQSRHNKKKHSEIRQKDQKL
jgi:hypothetical protein